MGTTGGRVNNSHYALGSKLHVFCRNSEQENQMQISARNSLKGRVTHVEIGAVNAEIEVELNDGLKIVSIITKASAERLRLEDGKEVYAVIKASDVMIATE